MEDHQNSSQLRVALMNRAYHEMLDAETRPVPDAFRRDAPMEPGPTLVPVNRYVSRAYHELEKERLWKRVWQMAAHEDDMPEVGDVVPYDIAGLSFLIVREAEDSYRAYYNACLHRGRKLCEVRGKRMTELRCPFHAWAWNLDGSLKQVPCKWDFPEMDDEKMKLPEARVARWGRYIFINPDPDAAPFEDFIGDLSDNFETWPYEKLYKQAHVAKVLRCNWKLAQEAFQESYHVIATHPQILMGGAHDTDTKYDAFGNYSRAMRAGVFTGDGLPPFEALPDDGRERVRHPLNGDVYELQDDGTIVLTDRKGRTGRFDVEANWLEGAITVANPHLCNWIGGPQLPEGMDETKLRRVGGAGSDGSPQSQADLMRATLKDVIGDAADAIPDIEFCSIFLTLFPNFHPWGSFNRINYRFRPNGDDHESCIMECIYLAPIPEHGEYEPCRGIHFLGVDDDWTDAPELGMLARVFNQDVRNLPHVHDGLKATAKEHVWFADYNETKPRHFESLMTEWVGDLPPQRPAD